MSTEYRDLFKVGTSNCCDASVYNDGRCSACLEHCEVVKEIYHFLGKKKLKTACGKFGNKVDSWTSFWETVNCGNCLKSKPLNFHIHKHVWKDNEGYKCNCGDYSPNQD